MSDRSLFSHLRERDPRREGTARTGRKIRRHREKTPDSLDGAETILDSQQSSRLEVNAEASVAGVTKGQRKQARGRAREGNWKRRVGQRKGDEKQVERRMRTHVAAANPLLT